MQNSDIACVQLGVSILALDLQARNVCILLNLSNMFLILSIISHDRVSIYIVVMVVCHATVQCNHLCCKQFVKIKSA